MGERLNSSQPKLCLESNLITGQSFLALYCSYFHAIEQEFNCVVPVAIMTSHATNDPFHCGISVIIGFYASWKRITTTDWTPVKSL